MATVTAGHHPRPRDRFALAGPPLSIGLALGVLTGAGIIALLYGFTLTLAIGALAAIPVLYALNALLSRANNYVILHDDRLDLKIWALGDLGRPLMLPYEAVTAVRVHPTADLLQVRYVYDDGEQAAATVELRSRDDALTLADELNRRRKEARLAP